MEELNSWEGRRVKYTSLHTLLSSYCSYILSLVEIFLFLNKNFKKYFACGPPFEFCSFLASKPDHLSSLDRLFW